MLMCVHVRLLYWIIPVDISYVCQVDFHLQFFTEDGVPYTVQIFAENSAGNGTVCNVTDFTNELGEFHCSASVCGCLFFHHRVLF